MLDTSPFPTTLVDKPKPQTSPSGDIIVQMLDPAFPKESEFTGLESLSVQREKGGTYVRFQGTAPVSHPPDTR